MIRLTVQLETEISRSFLASLFQSDQNIESFLHSILNSSRLSQSKEEFFHHLRKLWIDYFDSAVNLDFIKKVILLLRLAGLLKRKYYQRSILGTFLLAYNLKILDYLQLYHNKHKFIFDRYQTSKIGIKDFELLLISCSKWYISILRDQYSGWKLQTFQDVLCQAFDWYLDRDYLKTSIRPLLKDHLNQLYLQLESRPKQMMKRRGIPIHQPTKEPFILPKKPHRERGLVLLKVLTEIYDWITTYVSITDKNATKNYDPPFFDILVHAREAKVTFRDNEKKVDAVKAVHDSQYTRAITWIFKKQITNRDKIFLIKTESLKQFDKVGIKPLELVTFIRKHLMLEYIKVYPNKKRRVLVFNITSNLIDRSQGEQRKNINFSCVCCNHYSSHTKIDCLFFKRLEYLVSFGHITIPDNLKSLYNDRIKPIFSTKVACSFLELKGGFSIQLSAVRGDRIACIFCHESLEKVPAFDSSVTCECGANYSYISPEMTRNNVFQYQNIEQQGIFLEHGLHELLIEAMTKHDFTKVEEPVLKPKQLFRSQIEKIKRFSENKNGYLYIHENDYVYYDQSQKQLLINKIIHSTDKLTFVDTEKWNFMLQTLADDNLHLKFNYRPDNANLAREDKATLLNNTIPILQIKRPRIKEMDTYPLNKLRTVYNVGKPRLNKIFKSWGVDVIHSSTKGVLQEPTQAIKETMELPGVREALQQLHVRSLMISLMNATYCLTEIARLNNQNWLANRYYYWMNKILLKCPTRLENYYQDVSLRSFRQVSALEAWFSRPFAEGVRKFIQAIQDQNNPLIQRPYGRSVARRVNKEEKKGVDFMGGYTPFDTALNCVNRRLRNQLRIWNAKQGLGYETIPLFVHTAKDKTGRSGHLDLEEVGRILSRLTLCEVIVSGEITPLSFQKRYDDDRLPYYVPRDSLVRWLRGVLVKKKIFQKMLFYNNQWMTFESAHKLHTKSLCLLLEDSLEYRDINNRIKFLKNEYKPLIFFPDFTQYNQ